MPEQPSTSGLLPPEANLPAIFEKALRATAEEKPARKETAFRWLNRLYYDVRRWNRGFITTLKKYPGFNPSATAKDYQTFFLELETYTESLDQRYGEAKEDLCANLKMLDGRFTLDFKWLYGQDRDQYFALRSLVQESYQGELRIVDEATEVLRQVLAKKNGEETSPEYGNRFNSEEWIKWHLNSSQTIVRIIEDYENRSREAVKKIHDVAYNTGVKILTTAEYERALLDPQHHPEVLPMEPYSQVVIRVERSKEEYIAHEKHEEHKTQRLNTILSYTFGVVFITAILESLWRRTGRLAVC